ncbi:acyl-CoA thioesterase [Demequina litorisediminis]|uniref:Acyl-CoA thioesterase-like N-terminal HotDog domain-containing protein n=1 Tax=Demequina litorisediminis TaxID=1849022 RepID=A0ABQ6IFV8_9MICO|nr:hypothetical protein GCM10025876_29960 [Demequina litorisediminis]
MPHAEDIWAGEAVASGMQVLDLRRLGDTSFEADSLPMPGGRAYGGQVLAQALLAAGHTVEAERLMHSMHGYFLRPGDASRPITFEVEVLRDGRSFSARRTHAFQDGQPILSMIASFQPAAGGPRPSGHDARGSEARRGGLGARHPRAVRGRRSRRLLAEAHAF